MGTGKCPAHSEPCSSETSETNTICYPTDELDNCPITAINFQTVAKKSELKDISDTDKIEFFSDQNAATDLETS